jgi:hypothetical protein
MRIGSPKTLCSSVASVRKCSRGHCFAGPKIDSGVKTKKDSGREIYKEPSCFSDHSGVIFNREKFFQNFLQFLFLDQKELFVHVVEVVFFQIRI